MAVTVSQLGPVLNPMVLTCGNSLHLTSRMLPNGMSAGQAMITMCPRSDLQLTYMIDIALTMEFAISAGGVR